MSRAFYSCATAIAAIAIAANAIAQTRPAPSAQTPPPQDTVTVRSFLQPQLPPPTIVPVPAIPPITLGVPTVSPPGPSTFTPCANNRNALGVPGVDCR